MAKRVKLPADPNQKAKAILDLVTGEKQLGSTGGENPAAVALGKLDGLKGGKARANSLTSEERA